jgi:NAD(P)-dependent dehydrogenase (short-subunit alcohol dehydrogenase family)
MQVAVVQPTLEQASEAASLIPSAAGFAADVRDVNAVESMIEAVAARFGRIDVLVNNAALTGRPAAGAFVSTTPEEVTGIIDVNLKGVIWCSQAVSRHMIARGIAGSIVHVSSVGAFAAQELASIYCATKAALVALTRGMALELAPHGIRVNAVAPGDILTPASANVTAEITDLGGTGKYFRQTPLGRRGTPHDIGQAVAFLVDAKAEFITGATLVVDGGFLTY